MPDTENRRIQLRRGTSAEWTDANTVLAEGEPGHDTDDDVFKIGDGVTRWVDLPAPGGGGGAVWG